MPVTIKSKRHLFRRGGHAHPKDATTYPDGHFTQAQLAAFQAEPMLTVTITEPEQPESPEGNPPDAEKDTDADPGEVLDEQARPENLHEKKEPEPEPEPEKKKAKGKGKGKK